MPGSALIDIDELRRSIPGYREQRKESSLLSYQKAKEAIEAHLRDGQSVIVDKAVSHADTLDSFVDAGQRLDAEVYEILLIADKGVVQERADARGYRPGSLLNRERVGELWEQLDALKKERAEAVVIDTSNINLDQVYEKVRSVIA